MDLLKKAIIHAIRGCLRAPGFTGVVLLTLALGIGANTAMFSLTHSLLLKPMPYPEPDRLVSLWEIQPPDAKFRAPDGKILLSAPNFFDWRDQAQGFEGMALYRYAAKALDLAGRGEAESVQSLEVGTGFFELLGARPLLGRSFTREDERTKHAPVAMISHGLWLRHFGGDPSVLGQTVLLGGRSTTILGVLPPTFQAPVPERLDLFLPIYRDPAGRNRQAHSFRALARLQPGLSLAQASAELERLAHVVRDPHDGPGWSAAAVDLHRDLLGDRQKPMLLLMGAVLMLLLIACANVANMLLARGTTRTRETSIRAALGATRQQLLIQHLAEGLVLGVGGGLLGMGFALGTVRVLPWLLADTGLVGPLQTPELSPAVLLFACGLSLATSLVFGLVPTLQAWRTGLHPGTQRSAQGSPRIVRLRSLLVLGEVALATVLLLGSGLLLRSFVKLLRTHPGFDARQVVAFQLGLPGTRYPEDRQVRAFNEELVRRLQAIPGVEVAGSAQYPPLGGEDGTVFHLGESTLPPDQWTHETLISCASPGYLKALRVPMLQGQDFSRTGAHPEAIVNAAFVRKYFPAGDALGKRLQVGLASALAPEGALFEVVGVMGDQRTVSLEKAAEPKVLVSNLALPDPGSWYFLRSNLAISALAGPIRAQVAAMDGQLALRELMPLETFVDRKLGDRRQSLFLLGGFALLALVLSGIGIYGVVAFSVAQRTREIGLRMALGADLLKILRMVLAQGLRPVMLGCLLGLATFAGLSRILASQLYEVPASDPMALLLTLGLLSQAGLLACLIPALRAARVDPAVALRSE